MKPLSPVDQLFLWLEQRQQPMHVGGLQLFSFPEGAPDDYVVRLAESLREYQRVSPPFNQRLSRRLTQPVWVPDEALDLEHHFRLKALPTQGSSLAGGWCLRHAHGPAHAFRGSG